jgi:two-component system OmpR family response regulator
VVAARVLVIEDSRKMGGLLKRGLEEEGYQVVVALNGDDGVWTATTGGADAIVLDIGLPDIDGFEVCQRIRAGGSSAPIIMLTARDAVHDRVRRLDAGADDYLSKPFAFAELAARLRALVRRGSGATAGVLRVGDLLLDPRSHEVQRRGVNIDLTPREFALLEFLMSNPGEVLSRSTIIENVWDWAYAGASNVVDVYVKYLREKIDRPFGTDSIQAIRGAGYKLRVNTSLT